MFPQFNRKFAAQTILCGLTLLYLVISVAAQIGGVDPDPSDAGTGGRNMIAGNVYFPSGRKVDKRIRVRLTTSERGDITTTTDDNGAFSFHRLAPGTYTVVIDGEKDYEPIAERIDITQPQTRAASRPGQNITLQIQLRLKASSGAAPSVVSRDFANVPQAALDFYRKALELAQAGNSKAAVEQLRQAIAVYSDFMLAFNELGVQYVRLGDLEKADRTLQTALKIAPDAFAPLLNHGIVLVLLNRYPAAEPDLRGAVNQDEQSALAHYYLGRTLARLRHFDEAEGQLTRALDLGGDEVKEAHRYLGAIYNDRGDNLHAIVQLETYLRLAPSARDADQIRQIIQQLKRSSTADGKPAR
jgi:Flp pilus assembly protein TadD